MKRGKKEQMRTLVNFYSVFFFGIIPIIVTSMLLVKTLVVYKSILIIDSHELETYIVNSNWMEIGFSVISIAVSVWLGLNIANLIDRKQIEELNNKIDESEERLENGEKNITDLDERIENTYRTLENRISNINIDIENRFYKTRFIDKLMETNNLYESSLFLYERYYDSNEADFQELYQIESEYLSCIEAYESTEWIKTHTHSNEGIELLNKFEYEEKHKEYFLIRKSDFLFYKNIVLTHDNTLGKFSCKELEESIALYKKVISLVDDKPEKYQKFIGYLYNTIGYTYDILQVNSEEDAKKRYSALAISNMEVAVQYNDKGRYYRNLGLAYQHNGNLEKAKEYYKKAFEKEPKDYKAYNDSLAIILRELDEKFAINNRFNNNILISELGELNSSDKIILLEELKEVNKYKDFAEKSNCWFEDIQYNTCKMYMYLYIFSGYSKTEYIEMAIEYGKRALFLNSKSIGGKFCLRNAYECWGKLEDAKKINDELMVNNSGDSKNANIFYLNRMNGGKLNK